MRAQSPEQAFATMFRERGGIFRTDDFTLPPEVAVLFEPLRIHGQRLIKLHKQFQGTSSLMPDVYFNFIGNLSFRASTGRAPSDFELIGLHTGVVVVFDYVFNALLADPSVFPGIGNVAAEQAPPLGAGALPMASEIVNSRMFTGEYLFRQRPIDMERQAVALLLTKVAVDSVLLHELAHLRFGHYDYYMDKESADQAEVQSEAVPPLSLQTIEAHADCYAARYSAGTFLNWRKAPEPGGFLGGDKGVDVWVVWHVFIYVLFNVMAMATDESASEHEAWETEPYPPASSRQVIVRRHIGTHLWELDNPGIEDDWRRALHTAQSVIESMMPALMRIFGPLFPALDLFSELTSQEAARIDHIETRWIEARKELLPFTRSVLPSDFEVFSGISADKKATLLW